MEVQGLQEALKVEIQCHQGPTLCKGLNEVPNGQKLAVRSCPVGAGKPPSLIKPAGQAISKAPVAAVTTTHLKGQKAPPGLEPQPVGAHPPGARKAPELPSTQMSGSLSSVPVTVPQVSSPQRAAGQVLPQVRPKTPIPDSLPHSPCRNASPAHPGPRRQPYDGAPPALDSGGPAHHGAGVAYAIISADANGVAAVSEAVKVIIIQPQAPGGGGEEVSLPLPSPTPTGKMEKDPTKEKISFMVALGLVTNEHLEELQLKRQERKRRSTANPAYSGLFEPERKRPAWHYLTGSLFLSPPDSEDFCWKDEAERDQRCAVCRRDGELRPCRGCPRAFHPDCLWPPLESPPRGPWYCPKCHKKVLNKENMSWPRSFVQSYVTHKTVRLEEKRRLLRRNVELKKDCAHLEEEDRQLSKTLRRCLDRRDGLAARQRDTLAALERLKTLIRLIRLSVTTASALTPAGLPSSSSPSWMKSEPSASPLRTLPGNK
ncbi:PHD finger protein 21B isoform X1 [Syngnathus scovelli]|uniref:PHD finger protein 21B isoform X1 n=1 Tax=Syngnathus scovelli TaxID=161590 RepID=UPI00210F2DE3|nr:PHD finger protein 21B isoform X1 [Syngnathus scovelli]